MYSFILAVRVLHFAGKLDVRELNTGSSKGENELFTQ
jgi:hypothetical protein